MRAFLRLLGLTFVSVPLSYFSPEFLSCTSSLCGVSPRHRVRIFVAEILRLHQFSVRG